MPSIIFKIFAVLAGIVIWKAFMSMIAGFRAVDGDQNEDEEDDDHDDGKGPVPQARRDYLDEWRAAAEELGCKFDPGSSPKGLDTSITGHFSGREITVKRFGRNYVRYFVQIRRFPGIPVCVVRDLDTVAERILDGHPIFPSRMFFPSSEPLFFCSAESEEAFDRFLAVPSNRSAVLNLVRLFPACTFNPQGVSVRLRATVPVVSVIDDLAAIANALESPSDTPMPDLRDPRRNKQPRVSPSVANSQVFEPEPEREDTPKRYAPLKVDVDTDTSRLRRMRSDPASDRTTVIRLHADDCAHQHQPKPAPAGETASRPLQPSDRTTVVRLHADDCAHLNPQKKSEPRAKNVSGPADAMETPRTPESANEPATAPETPSNAPETVAALAVDSVCAVLFAKPFPGAEERAAFDAMKGRRVRWQGELLSAMTFSMDFVFGSRKGVKAVLAVAKIQQTTYGAPIQIKAVAAFPPELQQELEAAKGRTIAFEGTLLKFEPFAREIYLEDASLGS